MKPARRPKNGPHVNGLRDVEIAELFSRGAASIGQLAERFALSQSAVRGAIARAHRDARRALIRLLSNEVADTGPRSACGGECEDPKQGGEPGNPYPVCSAMRALGWGQHWDARAFERRAAGWRDRP